MTLDLLRDTLLLSLVLMLVYVLYKRLQKVIRRDSVDARYILHKEDLTWDGVEGIYSFQLIKATHLIVTLHADNGDYIRTLTDSEHPRGQQSIAFQRESLPVGRYYLKVHVPGQDSSLYFAVQS
jgi:hypothetical protein